MELTSARTRYRFSAGELAPQTGRYVANDGSALDAVEGQTLPAVGGGAWEFLGQPMAGPTG